MGTTPGTASLEKKGTSRSARGSDPFNMMQPTRTVRQTLGFETNHTINYAYIVRRFKSGADLALNKGQLVFIRKSHPPEVGRHMYTIMNLPQMNFYIRKWQIESPDLNGNEIDIHFAPHGVIQGEVGGRVEDQPQERLLNLTIMGRTRTFNVFGNHVPDGTPLYMVLAKVSTALLRGTLDTFVYALDGRSETLQGQGNGLDAVWCYLPYGNCETPYPTKGSLATMLGKANGADDVEMYKVYYLGRLHHHTMGQSKITDTQQRLSLSDVQRMVTLPMVEIFSDYAE